MDDVPFNIFPEAGEKVASIAASLERGNDDITAVSLISLSRDILHCYLC
jgi:hypothetical protein